MYFCDTYYDNTIKVNERKLRGGSNKFLIRSPDVRVLSKFQCFLNNVDDKERQSEMSKKFRLKRSIC